MIFLIKLKQNLKFKILNIDSVSHLRKKTSDINYNVEKNNKA